MKTNLSQLLDDPIIRLLMDWAGRLEQPLYLVGGYLRDFLLGRQNPEPDFDLVAPRDFQTLARRWADESRGSLVVMDDASYRVVFDRQGQRWQWDFAGLRAPTIEEDLRLRDFTVNAIAWPIGIVGAQRAVPLLDPTNGLADLAAGTIRMVYDKAFQDDPVRLLRAVRFVAQLGFTLEVNTRDRIIQEKNLLEKSAGERVRDEFFKILAGQGVVEHIKLMDGLRLLSVLIPEVEQMKLVKQGPPHYLPLWEHSLETLKWMETILDENVGAYCNTPLPKEHYREIIEGSITRREVILLAALFHDIGKPATRTVDEEGKIHFYEHQHIGEDLIRRLAKDFKLSKRAQEILHLAVRGHMRPFYLTESTHDPEEVTPRARARFFRQLKDVGLDVLLISLADLIATYGPDDKEDIDFHRSFIAMMMEHYFGKHLAAQKAPLLLGRDLLEHFRLSPGPYLGFLLDKISEAQEEGLVVTKVEALRYLEENLKEWEEEYKTCRGNS